MIFSIFDGNVTADVYLAMLNDWLLPQLLEIDEFRDETLTFMQDGAPPHLGRGVRAWLNDRFQKRWIGRGGPTAWPARCPES